MSASAQVASGFLHSVFAVLRGLSVPAAGVAILAVNHWWAKHKARARAREAPNWPTVTATIDVTAVVQQVTPEAKPRAVASLTYFYRNPELQMGEYKRPFASKQHARQWATQFKGRTVLVHVNPDDLTDSILLERDVAGSDLVAHTPAAVTGPALDPMPQVISPTFRLICGMGELLGLAGLAMSAVLLCVNLAMHGRLRPNGFYWTAGILFGLCVAAAIAVYIHLMQSEEGKWLLHSYKRWCPEWMRWSVNLTGGSVAFKPLVALLNLVHLLSPAAFRFLHHPWAQALAPYVPYAIGCWLFFVMAAFHAALLRSQEELHISVVEA